MKRITRHTLICATVSLAWVACEESEDQPSETSGGVEATGGAAAGGMELMTGGAMTGGAMAGVETTTVTLSSCERYCSYLEDCNSCLYDENNECADQATCVTICEAEVPPEAASCVAEITGCDEEAVTRCYDATIGDDDCAKTCVFLEECGECFIDEETEDCMTLAACAAVCREVTPPAAAACIAAAMSCDAISGCYESP